MSLSIKVVGSLVTVALVAGGCSSHFSAEDSKEIPQAKVTTDSGLKVCSADFLKMYQNVSDQVAAKNSLEDASQVSLVLEGVLKSCEALMAEAPHGECEIKDLGAIISDQDFEKDCLDAADQFSALFKTTGKMLPVAQAQVDPMDQNLLKANVDFEVKATSPTDLAQQLSAQKVKNNYILYFVGGNRLTQSPNIDQIGIGCSVYSKDLLTAADLSKPFSLSQKIVTPVDSGAIVHFILNANGKRLNLQCFKKLSKDNATFTLDDITKHLGSHFEISQNSVIAQ